MKASEMNKAALENAATAIMALNQAEWIGLRDEMNRQFAIAAEKNTLGAANTERIVGMAMLIASRLNSGLKADS